MTDDKISLTEEAALIQKQKGNTNVTASKHQSNAKRHGGWFESILIAAALALVIRHFFFQAYKIPSGSMIPNLLIGDQLIASKIHYGIRLPFAQEKLVKFAKPEYGEIVVFRYPQDPSKDFIKRTIALPGDTIRIEEGDIYINGTKILRTRLGEAQYIRDENGENVIEYREQHGEHVYSVFYTNSMFHSYANLPEMKLGDDEIFVMGDNRDYSNDSRAWGTVDLDLLQGKPLVIHFSWDSEKSSIRWDRLGKTVQ